MTLKIIHQVDSQLSCCPNDAHGCPTTSWIMWVTRIMGLLQCVISLPRKIKSHESCLPKPFFHNYLIILKFCTEHGSDTAMLCAKFLNDWATERNVMDEWVFARSQFTITFTGVSYTTTNPNHFMELYCQRLQIPFQECENVIYTRNI